MNNDAQLDSLIKKMAQDHQPELSGPGVIWWRAQIQKKLAEKKRIERPMVIMQQVTTALCALVVLAVLAANWRQILPVTENRITLFISLAVVAASVFMAGIVSLFRSTASRT